MAVGVNAQRRAFVCTNNNVAIRKGPGKNYPLAHFVTNDPCKLNKGYVVKYLGKKQNGYYYIDADVTGGWGLQPPKGWVNAQYLRPATICSKCDGMGRYNNFVTGFVDCERCKGRGYK